jgi:DNA invertase Pin-like site-specific DNA recombinase
MSESWYNRPVKKVALYTRISTSDGQTVENQLRDLNLAAERLGWTIVAHYSDEGISGAKGRDKRPGLDALMKGIARREFQMVASWSVCRLGRSLQHLVTLLGDLDARGVDLYLHVQGLDTSTPSGRAMFQMLGVFSEFERAMISERVRASLRRVKAEGQRLGRPPLDPVKDRRIRKMLNQGISISQTARTVKVGLATVHKIKTAMAQAA